MLTAQGRERSQSRQSSEGVGAPPRPPQQGWTRAPKGDPSWRPSRDRLGSHRNRAAAVPAAHAPGSVAVLFAGPPSWPSSSSWLSAVQIGQVTHCLPTQACTRCHCGPSEPPKHLMLRNKEAYGTRFKAKGNKTPSSREALKKPTPQSVIPATEPWIPRSAFHWKIAPLKPHAATPLHACRQPSASPFQPGRSRAAAGTLLLAPSSRMKAQVTPCI